MPRQNKPHSGDRSSNTEPDYGRKPRRGSHGQVGKVLVAVGFLTIVLLIAKEEFPLVADWIDRTIDADSWNATDQCRKQALQASSKPEFARVVEPGITDTTQSGYFVHDILIGEMGQSGEEQNFQFSCYVSDQGVVVKTSKQNVSIRPPGHALDASPQNRYSPVINEDE